MSGGTHVAVACGATLGESATWSAREGALYWVDIRAPALHRWNPATQTHRTWPLPELCGGVVPAASGVVLALRHELAWFDVAAGQIARLGTVEPKALGNRLNEAKCDRAGRLWVGSMRDFAAAITGSLYRIGRDFGPERVLRDVTVPNSLGWSPDGRTMYFTDTPKRALRAYAYDPDTGSLGAKRVVLDANALPGRPDGCTVDAEGFVWTTRFGAGQVVRVAPDGRVAEILTLPTSQPTSCALGGSGLRTLFITTARQKLDPAALAAQPEAGHLFVVDVGVPGLPDPEVALALPVQQ